MNRLAQGNSPFTTELRRWFGRLGSIFTQCENLARDKVRAARPRPVGLIFMNRMASEADPPHMHNAFCAILGLIAPLCLAATISNATASPPAKEAEDRYMAARDAAIEKISAINDSGNADTILQAERLVAAALNTR
jgi:hypothetical protein